MSRPSDWSDLARFGLGSGHTLKDCSRAYRAGNRAQYGTDHSPEHRRRSVLHERIGYYLRRGHSFAEAHRLALENPEINPKGSRRNPGLLGWALILGGAYVAVRVIANNSGVQQGNYDKQHGINQ